MQRDKSESQEHLELIGMMYDYFEKQGVRNLQADLPGVSNPELIHGTKENHIPDLTGNRNGTKIILEAETSSSINHGHTTSQWSLFADAAQKSGGEFHVVVPKGARSAAQRRADTLGIRVHNIWTPK